MKPYSKKIKVLLADGQYLTRLGMRILLSEMKEYILIGEALDRSDLRLQLVRHSPQIVVLELNNTSEFDLECLSEILSLKPETGILIFTGERDRDQILRAMEMGVNCFLTKICDQEEIKDALQAVSVHKKFFCIRVLEMLLEDQSAPAINKNCQPVPLSGRELEIVKLISQGKRSHEIAAALFLSIHTINTHRKNIFRKMGIRTANELVSVAIQSNWIS